ncbi:UDP-glucose 4-epimerase GalE [Cytobacillus sp. IB215665]|uniref:UDP-glucose 4-epimerase GalE n=1 Tax=Cytobacillus sp. IB215665 TaxID=3097357 RepID=UPI002A16BA65|nr:UDP-glucose 4-epimerase GalE [Cytobacillus sp. IB215665]MDX8366298.1 UDP-glucose 4-epimerase GalE [Cytobacillus sp. IB215665]
MKAVLVTGGAGYIGSHTVQELLRQNIKVIVLDNLSTGHKEAVNSPYFYIGDIADDELLRDIIYTHQVDSIIHFAAKSLVSESLIKPEEYFRENTFKTCSFFEKAIQYGVKRIVFSSTAAVYGITKDEPINEMSTIKPINPYGESKYFTERFLYWLGKKHKIQWIVLRYFNAAGASLDGEIGEDHHPESHLIPLILQTALGKREFISVFGNDYPTFDGTCIRDYIHVIDLANAHIKALKALLEGKIVSNIYNVGTGKGYSVANVINVAREVTNRSIPIEFELRREGDPPILVADSTALQKQLKWKPAFSDLTTIIDSAWNWHFTHPNGYK